jgi:5-hydroxyisourate hydrolase
MSQITCHILDTTLGKPAAGVSIHLQKPTRQGWENLASGITNSDGRITDLLPREEKLAKGIYSMLFDIEPYFDQLEIRSFYPSIRIEFEVFDESHYHIPLLLSPFGYSTYRGS